MSISIEDVLTWLPAYVYYPIETLYSDVCCVQVNASMLTDQSKPIKIAYRWGICLKLCIFDCVIDLFQRLYVKVKMRIGNINLPQLKTRLFSYSFEVFDTDLSDNGSMHYACVVKDPYYLWKIEPLFICLVNKGFFSVLFDERDTIVWIEQLLNPRAIPNLFPFSVTRILKPMIEYFIMKWSKNVSNGAVIGLIFFSRVSAHYHQKLCSIVIEILKKILLFKWSIVTIDEAESIVIHGEVAERVFVCDVDLFLPVLQDNLDRDVKVFGENVVASQLLQAKVTSSEILRHFQQFRDGRDEFRDERSAFVSSYEIRLQRGKGGRVSVDLIHPREGLDLLLHFVESMTHRVKPNDPRPYASVRAVDEFVPHDVTNPSEPLCQSALSIRHYSPVFV
jgi:hypothetical protein